MYICFKPFKLFIFIRSLNFLYKIQIEFEYIMFAKYYWRHGQYLSEFENLTILNVENFITFILSS